VKHSGSQERTTLERLERLQQHTEIIGRILRDLRPLARAVLVVLGVSLSLFVALLR
jgi:hypothetical protein